MATRPAESYKTFVTGGTLARVLSENQIAFSHRVHATGYWQDSGCLDATSFIPTGSTVMAGGMYPVENVQERG